MESGPFSATIEKFENLTHNVFALTAALSPSLHFKAGQWLSLVVPGHEGKPLRRPYSIASPPESPRIELCIQKIPGGPGTTFLEALRPGDHFESYGPYGVLVYRPAPTRVACFVSTGTGIAPFRSILMGQEFKNQPPHRTVCLLGVRRETDILYEADFLKMPGLEWTVCLSQGGEAAMGQHRFSGRVTAYLETATHLPVESTDYYLCGNGAMIREVKAMLLAKGVSKKAIFQEAYF